MKGVCYVCGTPLNTHKGQIICIVPVLRNRVWLDYAICRHCFFHFVDNQKAANWVVRKKLPKPITDLDPILKER